MRSNNRFLAEKPHKTDLLVISSYPGKGSTHGPKTVGLASYTKMLVDELNSGREEAKIEVLADTFRKDRVYWDGGIRIRRLWQRNQPLSWINMVGHAMTCSSKTVLVSFEVYMFGGLFSAAILPLLLVGLKLVGKRSVVLMHQVVDDFAPLEKNERKAALLGKFKNWFYKSVLLSADSVVVFEQELKKRLGNGKKIRVVPHLIPEVKPMEKKKARKKLGWEKKGKYVVFFGYLSPYKGVDWLVKNWPEKAGYKLVLAGGANPNHLQNKKIHGFVSELEAAADKKEIEITGFVPEKMVKYYLAAADVVILPYALFMSSSGPLALAIAHGKPVLLSKALHKYGKSKDMQQAIGEAGIAFSELTFAKSTSSLAKALERMDQWNGKYVQFVKELRRLRKPERVAGMVWEEVNRVENSNEEILWSGSPVRLWNNK